MIGLILGDTDLPKKILKKVKKLNLNYLIIDLSKKKIFKRNKQSYSASIGQFGKIIRILKENKCKKVLFAGKVSKPNFYKLKLDLKGVYYFPRILKSSKQGDAAILKEIIKILKKEKIITISSIFYNPDLSLQKGIYSKAKPDRESYDDIKQALIQLKNLNKYSFSQGVVARNKKIIAIEGSGGTEKMIKACKSKKYKKKGVLVKFPKEKQDLRIDLPTVGIKTFIQCKYAGLKGVVLKSKQNIFLDKRTCINFANKNKMFIIVK